MKTKFNGHSICRFLVCLFLSLILIVNCSCAQSGNEFNQLNQLQSSLKEGKLKTQDVLTSEKYLELHSDPAFRELIRNYAPAGKISIVTPSEPGKRIRITGVIVDHNQRPMMNILFYFYHTMHDGLYAVNKKEPGKAFQGQQSVAKLFGYIRTDGDGKFEINTIKPAGYPGEKFPSHVHIEIYDSTGKIRLGTEFQFADDPRLDKATRENSVRYGNLVSDNIGTNDKPVYHYKIVLPK
jgi:protocatechuate 3,4-dioxygenase, beta subunit